MAGRKTPKPATAAGGDPASKSDQLDGKVGFQATQASGKYQAADLFAALAEHFRTERAIDTVWRRSNLVLRSDEVIRVGDLVDAVLAKSPEADRKSVSDTFCRRIERYRPRPRRRRPRGAP